MNESPHNYTVCFGRTGRTVEYADKCGTVVFALDIGQTSRSLDLKHHPIRQSRPNNYDEAFARSKDFLLSSGYTVEESGRSHRPDPLTASHVSEMIRRELITPPPSFVSVNRLPASDSFHDEIGSSWNLWIVANVGAGKFVGYRVVFDEFTRQFGLVIPSGIFVGFWGSFRQTVDAIIER